MDYKFVGSLNILEILRNIKLNKKICTVIITSDKCYKNLNQTKRYREDDLLGDYEPYGASKAAVELAFHSYFNSSLKNKKIFVLQLQDAGM